MNCLNCNQLLAERQIFCGHCGQKIGPPGLSMHEIGHDLMHALVHVDRSVVSLMRALAARPGFVAREYVDGRRKRYFGPFAFLAIAVALSSAVISVSGFSLIVANDEHVSALAGLLRRHANLVTLIQVPLLSAICWLFFRRDRVRYAEHLVLAAYTSGIRAIFFAAVVVPGWYILRGGNAGAAVLYAYFALWASYFGFAAMQFYSRRPGQAWIKGFLATLAAEFIASAIFSAAASVYLSSFGRH